MLLFTTKCSPVDLSIYRRYYDSLYQQTTEQAMFRRAVFLKRCIKLNIDKQTLYKLRMHCDLICKI